jgi:hypothetical protein
MYKHETSASAPVGGDQDEARLLKRNSKDKVGQKQETGNKNLWGKVRNNILENQTEKPNPMPLLSSKKAPIKLAVNMYITK